MRVEMSKTKLVLWDGNDNDARQLAEHASFETCSSDWVDVNMASFHGTY